MISISKIQITLSPGTYCLVAHQPCLQNLSNCEKQKFGDFWSFKSEIGEWLISRLLNATVIINKYDVQSEQLRIRDKTTLARKGQVHGIGKANVSRLCTTILDRTSTRQWFSSSPANILNTRAFHLEWKYLQHSSAPTIMLHVINTTLNIKQARCELSS